MDEYPFVTRRASTTVHSGKDRLADCQLPPEPGATRVPQHLLFELPVWRGDRRLQVRAEQGEFAPSSRHNGEHRCHSTLGKRSTNGATACRSLSTYSHQRGRAGRVLARRTTSVRSLLAFVKHSGCRGSSAVNTRKNLFRMITIVCSNYLLISYINFIHLYKNIISFDYL